MKALQSVADGLVVRLGTLLSAALLGAGMEAGNVNLIVPAILVIVGVGIDMGIGALVKKAGR